MKKLNQYINEALIKNHVKHYFVPATHKDLIDIIVNTLKRGETDLNFIDVSNFKDLSFIFSDVDKKVTVKDIDISDWDVSNCETMQGMFSQCKEFNADISKWDVSNTRNISYMFYNCKRFNCDISKWDVYNMTELQWAFCWCESFNQDLSDWDVSTRADVSGIFNNCNSLKNKPSWSA